MRWTEPSARSAANVSSTYSGFIACALMDLLGFWSLPCTIRGGKRWATTTATRNERIVAGAAAKENLRSLWEWREQV